MLAPAFCWRERCYLINKQQCPEVLLCYENTHSKEIRATVQHQSKKKSVNSMQLTFSDYGLAIGQKEGLADRNKPTGGLLACCRISRSSDHSGHDASYNHSQYLDEEFMNTEHDLCSKHLPASGKSEYPGRWTFQNKSEL